MRTRVLGAVALVVVLCSRVSAHPAPFSYLDIVFRDGGIRGTLVVHVIDIAHELGVQPADLLNRETVRQRSHDIGEILRPRLLLRSSHRLQPDWLNTDLMAEDQAIKVDSVKQFEALLRELHKDATIRIFPAAGHGFANASGGNYVAAAADEAWKLTLEFFARHLGG